MLPAPTPPAKMPAPPALPELLPSPRHHGTYRLHSSTRAGTCLGALRRPALGSEPAPLSSSGALSALALRLKQCSWKTTRTLSGPGRQLQAATRCSGDSRANDQGHKFGFRQEQNSSFRRPLSSNEKLPGRSPPTKRPSTPAQCPLPLSTHSTFLSFPRLAETARLLAVSLGLSFVMLAALFLAPRRHLAGQPILGCHVAAASALGPQGHDGSAAGAEEKSKRGSALEVPSDASLASLTQAHAQGGGGIGEAWKNFPKRMQYALDSMLEKRPGTYILLLLTIISTLVLVGGTLFSVASTSPRSDPFWDAWSSLVTSSTHLKEKTTEGRTIGLLLTVGGLIFYSLLTSSLTAGFKQRMESLRQGAHSPVVESGHTIVSGTNLHLGTILKALNRQQEDAAREGIGKSRKGVVVIVTSQSKKEADKMVVPLAKECSSLTLLVRSGSTTRSATFKRVAAENAKAIILLATKEDPYDADAEAVASVLALRPLVEANSNASVVVEVSKPSTGELLESVPGLKVSPVQDLSAKLFVQCTRQPELFQVLLAFNPKNQMVSPRVYPTLAGLPYGELRRSFEDVVVLGIIRNGAVDFHPSDADKLRADDTLLIVSPKGSHRKPPAELEKMAKEGTTRVPLKVAAQKAAPRSQKKASEKLEPERILVLGWRSSVASMLREYDEYLGPGSEIVVLSNDPIEQREHQTARALESPLKNIRVVHKLGNPMSRKETERALFDKGSIFSKHMSPKDGHMAFENVRFSVTVVSNKTWRSGDSKADKDTLYSVLLAKLICQRKNVQVRNFTAEFQDLRMAKEALGSDPTLQSICSGDLLAALAARVSQETVLNAVWTELLNSWGNEFYLKDIERYISPGETPTFAELAERAVARKEVAVGYRKEGKVVINPCPKNAPLSFAKGDTLVVVSETEVVV